MIVGETEDVVVSACGEKATSSTETSTQALQCAHPRDNTALQLLG